MANGSVYVLRSGNSDLYKIGKAINALHRIRNLQTGSATPLEMVECISGPNYASIEKDLHKKYAKNRRNGEWFALNCLDIMNIGILKNIVDTIYSGRDYRAHVIEDIKNLRERIDVERRYAHIRPAYSEEAIHIMQEGIDRGESFIKGSLANESKWISQYKDITGADFID